MLGLQDKYRLRNLARVVVLLNYDGAILRFSYRGNMFHLNILFFVNNTAMKIEMPRPEL